MANSFVNKKADLTSTSATTLYTVPDASTAIVKSILVSEDSGNSDTIIDFIIAVVASGTVYSVVADVVVKSTFLFTNELAKEIRLRFCFVF